MSNVLVINASINGDAGNSSKLTQKFVEALQAKGDAQVTTRSLADGSLGHLSGAEMGAWMTAEGERTDEQKALAAISDEIVAEVQAADTIVIGMPMYNFGVPSAFKAWIDRVARAGITFKYTETGPVGLLADKKIYVLAARGGMYAGTPKDSQTPYLTDFFAFVGLTDIEFVYAEGLAMGEEAFQKAMDSAQAQINEKTSELSA